LAHTKENITDSIKTIISSVYESFKSRFKVTKTVSKQRLQSGLHLKWVNLWGAHVYIYLGGGMALVWVLEINK